MKKKLLFIYDSMMTGGTTTALLSLMNTIDRKRFDISLLLFTNSGGLFSEIPEYVRVLEPAYGNSCSLSVRKRKILRTVLNGRFLAAMGSSIKYRNTPKGNYRYALMHYGMAAQVSLCRYVPEEYDYAIGFMEGWANEYVASKKIKAKKKFVWIHPQYKDCYLIPEIDRKIYARVDGIALVSDNCMGQFLEFFPEFWEKTRVVPNLISPEILRKKAAGSTVSIQKAKINFCTVSRCDIRVKGLDRLLDVFCKLKEEGLCEDVLWHYIGGGPELGSWEDEINARGMKDTILLYGNQINPLPYLSQMDVFLLASRYEGKPVSVTEAQVMGLPCLVTNYESANTQVAHGCNGWIMENTYNSIYAGIKMVIQNPTLLEMWKKNTVQGNYGNAQDVAVFYDFLEDGSMNTEEEH